MGWREAMDLTSELAGDPSSHVAASLAGWQFPASREWLALKVMADNYVSMKTSKRNAKLEILPDPSEKPVRHVGSGAGMSTDDLRATLARHREQAATSAPAQTLN